MLRYALRSLINSLSVLAGVSVVVFLLLHMSGDPAALLLPLDATAEQLAALRSAMGLDAPLTVQYGRFVTGVLQGDFGKSILHQEPALRIALSRMPATLELTFWAFVPPVLIAIPTGVVAAVRHGTAVDRVLMSLSLLGQSIPVYFLGTLAILLFAVQLNLLPTGGRGTWQQVILPASTLGVAALARTARMVRAGMVDALSQDYVRTARAKGSPEWRVTFVHALRNVLIPVVTLIGLDLGNLLGGAVLTETIFAWPGVGRLAMQSISNRDYPVVQALVFTIATTYVVINLALDWVYAILDPRIRYT